MSNVMSAFGLSFLSLFTLPLFNRFFVVSYY
jgi:hypothetical protein